jgi:hypothetical protein
MPSQLPRRQDRVKPIDWVKDDVINGNSSRIMFESVDSLQIGSCECGEKIQEVKASQRVPAPLSFDPRSIAGGESGRRCMQVTGDMMLQDTNQSYAKLGSLVSSPGEGWSGRRGRRWSRTRDRRRPGFRIPSSSALTGSFPARFV